MQFISESVLNEKIEAIGASEDHPQIVQSLKSDQPALLAYLFSQSFELLTQKEKEYTMYLTLVVWAAIQEAHPEQEKINPKMIEKAEDDNWEKLNKQTAKNFRDKLDVFFDETKQEDLLAFLEDTLVQDEDDMVTKEGREYVFIAVKTIIDCLEQVT